MFRMHVPYQPLLGAALVALAVPATALACPPSLSVERAKTAPGDSAAAYLVVRAYPGCHPGPLAVGGTAEGLVGGERRTVPLALAATATPNAYAVRRQWPREGVWVLRLTVSEGGGHVTTLVGIGPSGEISTLREPPRTGPIHDPTDADVNALLRSLAAG